MANNRKVSVSGSKFFYQYETVINLDLVNSNNDIVKVVMNRIREDIKNYPGLLKQLKKEEKYFHIHDIKFGDILISDPDKIVYVCGHCN
jgi:hypothetical protein